MNAAHQQLGNGPDGFLDQHYVISAETSGPHPASGEDVTLPGLANRCTLSTVDLTDPQRPHTVQHLVGPERFIGFGER